MEHGNNGAARRMGYPEFIYERRLGVIAAYVNVHCIATNQPAYRTSWFL